MRDEEKLSETKKPRRKLLLPAILAVSLLGGSAAAMTACGDDDNSKPDTIVQNDKGAEATVGDAGPDVPDLLV